MSFCFKRQRVESLVKTLKKFLYRALVLELWLDCAYDFDRILLLM